MTRRGRTEASVHVEAAAARARIVAAHGPDAADAIDQAIRVTIRMLLDAPWWRRLLRLPARSTGSSEGAR